MLINDEIKNTTSLVAIRDQDGDEVKMDDLLTHRFYRACTDEDGAERISFSGYCKCGADLVGPIYETAMSMYEFYRLTSATHRCSINQEEHENDAIVKDIIS